MTSDEAIIGPTSYVGRKALFASAVELPWGWKEDVREATSMRGPKPTRVDRWAGMNRNGRRGGQLKPPNGWISATPASFSEVTPSVRPFGFRNCVSQGGRPWHCTDHESRSADNPESG
jgi:hypothetical protein